mmetsp:Transcript_32425/g.52500  ORF Transcript_32425/g.52500 Transcript_32425/m.52500 type:complete len:155 (-) Transcript_32425:477-941(-)|eukprot:CAMPEP_0184655732 /NCGR_PEP_ID=MMETSP0308-20130426/14381_1 /TAXON_ID=38269 /ORGANISM="Gloeochaete witrockiana, Strain SAG 46.84" /LENGTH=154 /DNA_ID=CAMNT_0027092447 /DNA_START=83 /DNA_END=547 /DNA_ORIENTATION=-
MSSAFSILRACAGPLRHGVRAAAPLTVGRTARVTGFMQQIRRAATASEVPDSIVHATGAERDEAISILLKDPKYVDMIEPLFDPRMGTEAEPIIVRSQADARIVGCTGGAGDESHDIMWMNVRVGTKSSCSVCGQWFSVQPFEELPGKAKPQIH